MQNIMDLKEIAKELRRKIFKMIYKAGGGHIAPAFSVVEILTALYFGGVLNVDPKRPQLIERDRCILSKGHASAALYAVLAQKGYFEEKLLDRFCQVGSTLGGHPNMLEIPGVEASTGALGHGFPYAAGIALAGKLNKSCYKVYCILGDGECQEGSVWEAALFAAHHKLENLTVILDYNKLQAMEPLDSIIKMEPMADKWRAFGWRVSEVDGHDMGVLLKTLETVPGTDHCPKLIIAHTVKGKGISFMENVPIWHYRLPSKEELDIVIEELEIPSKEIY
ncbi:MAG: transketolase [Clostridia bacterium]|nr:transketolase [Clostridia bacterium]